MATTQLPPSHSTRSSGVSFEDRSIDPQLLTAVQRFTNHERAVAPRAIVRPSDRSAQRSPHETSSSRASIRSSNGTRSTNSAAWIIAATVLLGLAITAFAAQQAWEQSSPTISEQVTSLQASTDNPGEVIVESVATDATGHGTPDDKVVQAHRYSISSQEAAGLHIGQTVSSRLAEPGSEASTSELLAAVVVGLSLIGVGALVIGATGTRRSPATS